MPNYLFCLAHFCEIHGPLTILCVQRQHGAAAPSSSKLSLCDSCALTLPDEAANLVTNTSGDTAYVLSRYPPLQKVYTSLMKLVMKCLSVETVADTLKPLFFGDGSNGFCLSKVFSIRDAHARGGERKYALLVVCDGETPLLQRWEICATYITEVILLVQRQVEAHLEARANTGDNERYLRRLKVMPRSLVELTNDRDIFVKIHLCGIELLKDIA